MRNRVDPRYFSHYFRTTDYRRTASNLAAGLEDEIQAGMAELEGLLK